jgi:hypothetical protein
MKLHCPKGCPDYKTREFNRAPDETHCTCGSRLETGMERNARKRASRNNGRLRDRSRAESEAAEEFHAIVVSLGCWAKDHREGHRCSGRVEAHHLIELSWWTKYFADLPEGRRLSLAYNPIIGAPLCGGFHAAVTAKSERIYFHELDRELIEHCERLDQEFPGRGVLGRLQLECPQKEPSQQEAVDAAVSGRSSA